MTYPDNEVVRYGCLPQMAVNMVVGSSTPSGNAVNATLQNLTYSYNYGRLLNGP